MFAKISEYTNKFIPFSILHIYNYYPILMYYVLYTELLTVLRSLLQEDGIFTVFLTKPKK